MHRRSGWNSITDSTPEDGRECRVYISYMDDCHAVVLAQKTGRFSVATGWQVDGAPEEYDVESWKYTKGEEDE